MKTGRRHALAAFTLAGWLSMSGALGAASVDGYRLAGVMVVGSDHLGFLELPTGGQQQVRVGSIVQGGKVTEFSDRTLRIVFPDHVVVLALDGLARPAPAAEPPPKPSAVLLASDTPGAYTREVDVKGLRAQLAAPPPPGHAPAPTDPRRAVGERLVEAVQVPPNARVLAVDDVPVTNAKDAISAIGQRLATGQVSSLNVQTANGPERVYLVPHGS